MNETILVAEDEPTTLKLLEQILERKGYRVVSAKDGNETLNQVHSANPALVVLDVMMPGLSGIQVCQRLRRDPATENIPIIMLSARGQVQDKVAGLEAGADEYVTKPISGAELIARVQSLLSRTKRLMHAEEAEQGQTVAFIGAKGGVGTTTVAFNVAGAFTEQGHETIAVELTSYLGTASLLLSQEPFRNLSGLLEMDASELDAETVRGHLHSLSSGLKVLFSPQKLSEFRALKPDLAKRLLQVLTLLTEYVVLDLPSCPSAATRAVIPEVDALVLVLEPEPVSAEMGKHTLEILRTWGAAANLTGAILVNRASLPMALKPEVIQDMLKCEMFGTVAQAAPALKMAQESGKLLVNGQPSHSAAINMLDIARQLGNALS